MAVERGLVILAVQVLQPLVIREALAVLVELAVAALEGREPRAEEHPRVLQAVVEPYCARVAEAEAGVLRQMV